MSLSIIIVNYNTKDYLRKCLESLEKYCSFELSKNEYEIIVVDNASADGSAEFLRSICFDDSNHRSKFILVENKENLGFAKANNIGISKSSGETILLLNSDTEVKEGTIQECLRTIQGDKGNQGNVGRLGIITCKILLENGQIDPACHRGFPTPWNAFCYFLGLEKIFPSVKFFSGYHQYYKNLDVAHEVEAISGAFFMIKKNVINNIGLLDEDYFMYGEDLDWCYRASKEGYLVWYNPAQEIIHYKKRSGRAAINPILKKQSQKHFWQTMRIFYEKHYVEKYPGIVNFIVMEVLKFLA